MRLNLQLLHALENRNRLLGMGLSLYWGIVLVANFHGRPDNDLGDVEMMKCVGGQSGPYWCNSNVNGCGTSYCVSCPLSKIGSTCSTSTYKSYTPELCSNVSGNEYCDGSVSAACQDVYICDCKPFDKKGGICNEQNTVSKTTCLTTGIGCNYTPCPNQ
jgi:hypothetical protein